MRCKADVHAAGVDAEYKAAILDIVEEEHIPNNLSEDDDSKGKMLVK
jgi:hypothetical protein